MKPLNSSPGDDENELILHLADYHRVLDNILACHPDLHPNSAAVIPRGPVTSIDLTGLVFRINFGVQSHNFVCQLCNYTTNGGNRIHQHLSHHLKEISRRFLPQAEPWICPCCFYESSSYYSSLR